MEDKIMLLNSDKENETTVKVAALTDDELEQVNGGVSPDVEYDFSHDSLPPTYGADIIDMWGGDK